MLLLRGSCHDGAHEGGDGQRESGDGEQEIPRVVYSQDTWRIGHMGTEFWAAYAAHLIELMPHQVCEVGFNVGRSAALYLAALRQHPTRCGPPRA